MTDCSASGRKSMRSRTEYDVPTTPQVWIEGERVGGYDALRQKLTDYDPDATTYTPVIYLFAVAAATALALSIGFLGTISWQTLGWFISVSMILLGMQKLRDIEGFTTMFLNYDLLARKWVPYAYVYPWVETGAGILMTGMLLTSLAAPAALFIATVGAVSVFKAVYIDKRELKCACVGGNSNVPLGFVSLTENLMMMGMAIVMLVLIAADGKEYRLEATGTAGWRCPRRFRMGQGCALSGLPWQPEFAFEEIPGLSPFGGCWAADRPPPELRFCGPRCRRT